MKSENKCCKNCQYKEDFKYNDIKPKCMIYDATTEDANVCDFWRG